MQPAPDISWITSALAVWHEYDPAVKAELWSTALIVGDAIHFVDPIDLAADELSKLLTGRTVAAVVVTNENHFRASAWFAKRLGAPLAANYELIGATAGLPLVDGDAIAENAISIVEVPGAPRGEIALHHAADKGTLVVGDALIHFGPYGFTFLPAKYCPDFRLMQKSLRKLLDYSFERLLFAHGTPITTKARQKLELLLTERQ